MQPTSHHHARRRVGAPSRVVLGRRRGLFRASQDLFVLSARDRHHRIERVVDFAARKSILQLGMQERRQNVRVRPSPDYEIRIDYEEGLVKVSLSVVDLAVGGIGVLVDELFSELKVDMPIHVTVTIPDFPPFETEAVLRHSTGQVGGRCGFHLASLTEAQQRAWSRAVSELLERGHSA